MPLPRTDEDAILRNIEERMSNLRRAYLDVLRERAVLIERALRQYENGDRSKVAHDELRAIVHKLAGTGATYGFPALSTRAREVETLLRKGTAATDRALRDGISNLLVACRTALGLDDIRNRPLQRTAFGRRAVPAPTFPSPPARRPKLLVVDDDPAVRDLFSSMLAEDADVLTATNSDEGLRVMRLHRPDLVLLDDIMPGGITGLKLLDMLHASGEFADTPIIMITASDAPEHKARGLAAGAIDYITKPFDAITVMTTMRRRLTVPSF